MSEPKRKRSSGQQSGPLLAARIINDALRKKSQGDLSDYNVIVKELCAREVDSVQLQRWLNGLRCCVSSMGHGCDKLVGATLQLSWAYRDETTVKAYTNYLTDLVAAHAEYMSPCVFMLLKRFVYDEERPEIHNELAFSRSMACLSHLLDLVPMGLHCVQQHLVSVCPYKGRQALSQEHFVRNCLLLADGFPSLLVDVIEILIEHLIKLDVDISKEDLEAELRQPNDCSMGVFQLEMEQGDGDTTDSGRAEAMTNIPAHKLDVCMNHMLKFIHKCSHYDNGEFHLDGGTLVFQALCKVFQKSLLMTHGTSHVQFVLFLACSTHQSFVEGFLHLLWAKAEDVSCSAVTRQAAAAYMASFVARAQYIALTTVKLCLDLMSEWILRYIQQCDSSARSIPDVNAHAVFFSIVQALMYIFLFRHKELLRMENAQGYLRSLQFERIVMCRLNPLKVCLSSVAEAFAAVTSKHEIVFCYTIIERNRRIVMPTTYMDDASNKAIHLGSFFPFDPYLLKQSLPWIEDKYVQWKDAIPDAFLAAEESSNTAESEPLAFPESPRTLAENQITLNLTPMSPTCMSPGFDRNSFT